jgi:CDP-diglyceride synthetase
MKKKLLCLYFFLAPAMVFLIGKTDWFSDIAMDIVYFLIILLVVTLMRKPKLKRIIVLLSIFLMLSIYKPLMYTVLYEKIFFPWYLAGGILIIAICVTWLYNQYEQPGKKNLVEDIFCFQVGFGFFAWLGSYFLLPSSWMIWTIMVITMLGGICACYNYCECSDEEIRD